MPRTHASVEYLLYVQYSWVLDNNSNSYNITVFLPQEVSLHIAQTPSFNHECATLPIGGQPPDTAVLH